MANEWAVISLGRVIQHHLGERRGANRVCRGMSCFLSFVFLFCLFFFLFLQRKKGKLFLVGGGGFAVYKKDGDRRVG